jgi:hypothetical protein
MKDEITSEESETLDSCYAALTEEQIVECEEEANEIAGAVLGAPKAADDLVRTLVAIIVRNAGNPQ